MNLERCFKRRKIENMLDEVKHSGLRRSLGLFQLVVLGFGAVIGVGILVLTGTVASQTSGPAVILSFALSAIAALCTGLCYSELAAMIPVSGNVYAYMYVAVGELIAWIFGFLSVVFFTFTASIVAVGWSGYLKSFLADYGMTIPAMLAHTTGTVLEINGQTIHSIIDLPAFCIVALITAILCNGTKGASIINAIATLIKFSILASFVVFGITKINPANFVPFIPENTGTFGSFGLSGIIGGASMVFVAYCGFDVAASAVQESKNPRRNIPLSIIISIILAAIVYMLVSGVMVGLVPYQLLNNPAPVALAVDALDMPVFSRLIKVGAVIGLIPVILGILFGVSRTLFTMAKDGLLPKFVSRVNSKTHVPFYAILMSGSASAILAGIIPLTYLVNLINICAIISYMGVCLVCVYLRYSKPNLNRDFKCPWMPFTPLSALALYAFMMCSLSAVAYKGFFIIIGIALVIYFSYGVRHSALHKTGH